MIPNVLKNGDAIRRKWPIGRNVTILLFVLALAFALPGLGYVGGLEIEGRKTLFILTLAIGLWVTEAIPPFATALLIVAFQIFFLDIGMAPAGDQALEKYTKAWASPVIWLLMGGFFLSLSLTLTGLDRVVFKWFARYLGQSSRIFLLGTMLVTAFLSMFMSNTAAASLVIAILSATLADPKQDPAIRRAMLLGVAVSASIGGMGTIMGSTPNAIAHGYLVQKGIAFGFVPWLAVGLPTVMILVPLAWGFITLLFKVPNAQLMVVQEQSEELPDHRKTLRRDRAVAMATFVVTVGLWMSAPFHSMSVSVVSLIPIVMLTVTGVVRSADIRQLPWDTLLLIMGGVSLGESVLESGLAEYLLSQISLPLDNLTLLLGILAFACVFFSTFMSNTAAAAILIPLGNSLVGAHHVEVTLTIALASSIGIALPVSTPPNAIAYAFGYLRASDFALIGVALGVIGPVLIVAFVKVLGVMM